MLKKILHLLNSFLQKKVAIDYTSVGLQRPRHLAVPLITNYIRISNFELIVHEIKEKKLTGAVAEVGVYKGEFAKYINQAFPDKKLYLFDTFEGFNKKDIEVENNKNFSEATQDFSNTSINEVLDKMSNKENCIVKKGYFPESLDGLDTEFCFVSLDTDLYKPILDGLHYFYPRLQQGGYIFVHDYNNDLYPGAKQAVHEFCAQQNIAYTPITDSWGTVIIAK